MSSTRGTFPNDGAEPLALPPLRVDIAQQLERLRQMETQLASFTRPSIEPAAAEEPSIPSRPSRSSRRRLLRRRSADQV